MYWVCTVYANKKSRRITITIDEETYNILTKLSKKLGVGHSGVVRMALRLMNEKLGVN